MRRCLCDVAFVSPSPILEKGVRDPLDKTIHLLCYELSDCVRSVLPFDHTMIFNGCEFCFRKAICAEIASSLFILVHLVAIAIECKVNHRHYFGNILSLFHSLDFFSMSVCFICLYLWYTSRVSSSLRKYHNHVRVYRFLAMRVSYGFVY